MTAYNKNNVFAKIIRGKILSKKIYEDDHVLCFEDAEKLAKIHWLIIPKTEHSCYHDFIAHSSPEIICHFFKTIHKIAADHHLDRQGYKLVTNNGENAGQSIFHFHVHLLSGENLSHL